MENAQVPVHPLPIAVCVQERAVFSSPPAVLGVECLEGRVVVRAVFRVDESEVRFEIDLAVAGSKMISAHVRRRIGASGHLGGENEPGGFIVRGDRGLIMQHRNSAINAHIVGSGGQLRGPDIPPIVEAKAPQRVPGSSQDPSLGPASGLNEKTPLSQRLDKAAGHGRVRSEFVCLHDRRGVHFRLGLSPDGEACVERDQSLLPGHPALFQRAENLRRRDRQQKPLVINVRGQERLRLGRDGRFFQIDPVDWFVGGFQREGFGFVFLRDLHTQLHAGRGGQDAVGVRLRGSGFQFHDLRAHENPDRLGDPGGTVTVGPWLFTTGADERLRDLFVSDGVSHYEFLLCESQRCKSYRLVLVKSQINRVVALQPV